MVIALGKPSSVSKTSFVASVRSIIRESAPMPDLASDEARSPLIP